MSGTNGNSLHSHVRLKFRSGTSMRRARDIWDVMVRQYESAAIVKDGRRLFLTIRPPKDDCRYVWMMMLCKDIVGIETNAGIERPTKRRKRYDMDNQDKAASVVRSDALLADLGRMARRWRRSCGRPGGASCEQEWANKRADDRVKVCIKELEAFIEANASLDRPAASAGTVGGVIGGHE
jgi:hypothetical protein